MEQTSKVNRGSLFPSHFKSRKEKSEAKWIMAYLKAFHEEYQNVPVNEDSILRSNFKNMERYRTYAKGKQPTSQYKELLTVNVNKNGGKKNESYKKLDWSIFRIAPKIKEVLFGKIYNRNYEPMPKPIDPTSISKERKAKFEYMEYAINAEHAKMIEQSSGVSLPKPGGGEEILPTDPGMVDLHMKTYYKNQMSIEMKDYISSVLMANKWDDIKESLIDDLIDTDFIAAKTYVDAQGRIKIRRCIPENMIINKCINTNFSDKIRAGEYVQCTIADLKERNGYKFGWTEDTYRKIANNVCGQQDKYPYSGEPSNNDNFPYDHERLTYLEAEFFSWDTEVKLVKSDEYGDQRLFDKPFDWKPESNAKNVKGLSDEEYKAKHNNSRDIIRTDYKNTYKGCWVVGTEYVFDYGPVENAGKCLSRLTDAEMSFIMHTSNFDSTIGKIESLLDNIQINWLQYQSHIAASRPPGMAFEIHALSKMNKGKKGGAAGSQGGFDSKEAIKQFSESGSFFYNGYDYDGRALAQKPFQEIVNGLSRDAASHLNFIFQDIDIIRTMLGLNAVTEGSSPDPDTTRYLANAMDFATENSLTRLYSTMDRFVRDLSKRISDLSADVIENPHRGLSDLIGEDSMRFISLQGDQGLTEFGIDIEIGIDQVMRERISSKVEQALANQEITVEASIDIDMEDNPYRMRQMLIKAKEEKIMKEEALKDSDAKRQTESNIASTQAAAQAKLAEFQAKAEAEANKEIKVKTFEEGVEERAFTRAYILKKLEGGQNLSEIEATKAYDLIIGDQENDSKEYIAEKKIAADILIAEKQAAARASAEKKKPSESKKKPVPKK